MDDCGSNDARYDFRDGFDDLVISVRAQYNTGCITVCITV